MNLKKNFSLKKLLKWDNKKWKNFNIYNAVFFKTALSSYYDHMMYASGKSSWRYYFTSLHHNWKSYDLWFLLLHAWQTKLLLILGHFMSFYPTINPKNQNFEKMKNVSGGIIILHKCIKNHDHMLYRFWDGGWWM